MVLFDLLISFESENVKLLTYGGPSYEWHLSIKCTQCDHTNDGEIYFKGDDKINMPDSKGECNFIMKCKMCKRPMTFELTDLSKDSIQLSEKVKGQAIATFECRGGEPIGWNAQDLKIQAESGTWFEECDLTDTWVEYDESTSTNCMIDNIKVEFQRSKKKN